MKLRNDHRTLDDLLEREETDEYRPVNAAEWHEIPSSALDQPALRKALIEAVIALPPVCRSVFVLRDVQQIGTHHAAMLLGLNEQTVKTAFSRPPANQRSLGAGSGPEPLKAPIALKVREPCCRVVCNLRPDTESHSHDSNYGFYSATQCDSSPRIILCFQAD